MNEKEIGIKCPICDGIMNLELWGNDIRAWVCDNDDCDAVLIENYSRIENDLC